MQAVADEWGFSDARMAATLLKRQEKMRKLQRDSERRKHKQDPIKRLEKLQGQLSHQYVPPHQASQPQPAWARKEVQHHQSPTQPVLISRTEPQQPTHMAMISGEPSLPTEYEEEALVIPSFRCSMGGAGAGQRNTWSSGAQSANGNYAGGGGALGAMPAAVVNEEIEVNASSTEAPPLRAFASDAPNAKLARSNRNHGPPRAQTSPGARRRRVPERAMAARRCSLWTRIACSQLAARCARLGRGSEV